MGEVTWLEVLGRGRDVLARHRLDGDEAIAIGRAYDNDLVLDDPAVAAHHLRLARDESGAWFAEDLGSMNGLFVDDEAVRRDRVAIAGNDEVLRIGRTYLRFRAASFAVPPERRIDPQPAGPRRGAWRAVGILTAVAVAMNLLANWLALTTKPEPSTFVAPLVGIAMMVFLWVGFWSLVSRLFAGAARFDRHLLVALVGLVASMAIDRLWALATYAFALPSSPLSMSALAWLLIAAVAYAHLRVIGPGRLPVKAASVGLIALAAFGTQWLVAREVERTGGFTFESTTLLPPYLRVAGGTDEASFFAGMANLKPKLEEARREEPRGESLFDE